MPGSTVDPVYVPFVVATPAGTLAAAPQVTVVALPDGTIEAIDVQVPPGHRGTTGFAVALSGEQVLPWSHTAAWITGDDLRETFDLGVQVTGKVTVVTYNVGAFPHSHYGRFRVRQLQQTSGIPQLRVISNAALGGGAA